MQTITLLCTIQATFSCYVDNHPAWELVQSPSFVSSVAHRVLFDDGFRVPLQLFLAGARPSPQAPLQVLPLPQKPVCKMRIKKTLPPSDMWPFPQRAGECSRGARTGTGS